MNPHAATVSDVLLEYEDRLERGKPASLEELCAECPELLPAVRALAANLEAWRRYAAEEPEAWRHDTPAEASGPGPEAGPPPPEAVPDSMAGYQLQGPIGEGAASIVYRAVDPDSGLTVAVKVLRPRHPGLAHEDLVVLMRRFEQEARILARLKHDAIVRIFFSRLHRGDPFFVMEYEPGGSLDRHLERLRASGPAAAARLMERVAGAVGFAHRQGILHRDLKPRNILLDAEGNPRVSDFGIAKLLTPEGSPDAALAGRPPRGQAGPGRLTASERQPGTRAYMAPEQYDPAFGPLSPATDVWAMGVILYELLTGALPFDAGDRDYDGWKEQVCRAPLPPWRNRRWGAGRRLEQVARRCLQKDPARRYPSAEELAGALRRAQAGKAWGWPALAVSAAGCLLALWLWLGRAQPGGTVPLKPPATPPTYEQLVEPLLRRLARGEEVEVIGPGVEGVPAHLCRYGQGWVDRVPAQGGGSAVEVASNGSALLELFPDPRRDAYQIYVEMCQQRASHHYGDVGIYFGYSKLNQGGGEQHFFRRLSFADLGMKATMALGPGGRPGSQVRLNYCYLGSSPGKRFRPVNSPGVQRYYEPPAPKNPPGPWRKLVVEVRPAGVTARWDDLRLGPIPPADWDQWLDTLQDAEPGLTGIVPAPAWRAPLGLHLYESKVLIRRFVVKPL